MTPLEDAHEKFAAAVLAHRDAVRELNRALAAEEAAFDAMVEAGDEKNARLRALAKKPTESGVYVLKVRKWLIANALRELAVEALTDR